MSAEDTGLERVLEDNQNLRLQIARLQLEMEQTLQSREKRLSELLALSAISQATAGESDLHQLYRVIHAEIARVMGDVNLMIAHYDPAAEMVEFPYAYEEGQVMRLDPFPLGEGLTSILIHTRRPLLLVEDAENQSRALGAKIYGSPAKSWLGVPLIVAGEVIGAIIVKDLEHEFRFDEADQRLLSTLAGQVAVVIRNASLLEKAREQTRRERLLKELNARLMACPDIDAILRTALYELGRALQASEGQIRL